MDYNDIDSYIIPKSPSPCPKCGSRNIGRYLSSLPCNSLFCRECGFDGPNTTDAFGAAEAAWERACAESQP